MTTRRHNRGGYATVLAMLLLVIGMTFSAWLYTLVSNNTAVVRNEQLAARAGAAADTALAFGMHELQQVANAGGFHQNDSLEVILAKLGAGLQGRAADELMPGSVTVTSAGAHVAGASYGNHGDQMEFGVAASELAGRTGFTLMATGRTQGGEAAVARTVCMEIDPKVLFGSSSMDFPIASKGYMSLAGNSAIYRFDPVLGVTAEKGRAVNLSNDGPGFLRFDNSPIPEEPLFPPTELPSQVYEALSAAAGRMQIVSENQVGKTLSSVRIAASTDKKSKVVFENCTINGVLYVEWPNTIELGGNVTLNGPIIYGRPGSDADNSNNDIILKRELTITNNVAAGRSNVAALFRDMGYSTEKVDGLLSMMNTWAIHAPYADFEFESGNTGGQRILEGNFQVATLGKSTGMGGGEAANLIIKGQILCEGEVDLGGNRVFCIKPPKEGDNPDFDRRLVLDVGNGAYWEKY